MFSKAKRAPRGSIKEPMPVPYTASSPFALSALSTETRKRRKETKSGGIFSRVVSAARRMLDSTPSVLRYGDILRDMPFHVNTRVVLFFSTHPSLCDSVFAVRHGECLCSTRGAWKGSKAIVVGVRGGALWVVGADGPATARPLVMSGTAHSDWERVSDDAGLVARLREGIEAARRDVELDYDSDQKEFLQKAPDLFAEVVDDDGFGDGRMSEDITGGRLSDVRRVSAEGGDSDVAERPSAPLSDGVRKHVTLVPQIVQATGGLGWAGEGMVVLNGGGVEFFSASLSASVLL